MSSEILRRAASLMRERAVAARWVDFAGKCDWVGDVLPLLEVGDDTFAHAASWHPAVALAVADWLDSEADVDECARSLGARGLTDASHAVAVARAFLGESS